MSNRVVLVTGSASGIGEATAAVFVERGWRVFGTSRSARAHPNVTMLPLDVRDAAAARACLAEVEAQAGHLDVLVNNAGAMLFGPVEEVPLDAAHDLFETNFWGVANMVNAALPAMRRRRRGHLVNIGSIAGRTAIPLNGFYAATKHALAGYTEALRHEVAALGIQVALIEPADFRTRLWERAAPVPPKFDGYAGLRASVVRAVSAALARAPEPAAVATRIVAVAESDAPGLRHPVGAWARALPHMKTWMPEAMFEAGMRRRFVR